MSTIKLKRGSGTPANSSLEQYEVAMDVTAKQLYTSTNGTDVVTLSNEYTNADADARVNLQTGANLDLSSKSTSDLSEGTNEYFTDARAVTAVEAANLTLAGTVDTDSALTATGGFTVDAQYNANPGISYGKTLFAKRVVDGGAGSGDKTIATLWRDLDSEVINSGYDNRGSSLDYVLESDSQGTRQYLGGVSMQSGGTATGAGHWVKAWAYDDGVTGFATDTIFEANKDQFWSYGRILAQRSATLQNQNGDDEAPLVVKTDWDNNNAVAAEFWNLTNNDENNIRLQLGTDDAGTKTYNNEIKSEKIGPKKVLSINALNDDGTLADQLYATNRDSTDGALRHNLYGNVRVDVDAEDHSSAVILGIDMENATNDFIDGVNTTSNFKGTTLPDGAEIFQRFTFADTAGGLKGAGYFGARYASANSGELTTMRLAAQTHDFTGEKEIGINQRNAFTNVPFRFEAYTTTERNALSVDNGSIIYNSTTNKMQAYAGNAWVDLHI
jgi:hypothetical protein